MKSSFNTLLVFLVGMAAGYFLQPGPTPSAASVDLPRHLSALTALKRFNPAEMLTNADHEPVTTVAQSNVDQKKQDIAASANRPAEAQPGAGESAGAPPLSVEFPHDDVTLNTPFPAGKVQKTETNSWGETTVTEEFSDGTTVVRLYSDNGLPRTETLTRKSGEQIYRSLDPTGLPNYANWTREDGTRTGILFKPNGLFDWRVEEGADGNSTGYWYDDSGVVTSIWTRPVGGYFTQVTP